MVYYSIYALFATWLQTEFKLAPAVDATPILLSNLLGLGRRPHWSPLGDDYPRNNRLRLGAGLLAH